jgi:hypothetical protein
MSSSSYFALHPIQPSQSSSTARKVFYCVAIFLVVGVALWALGKINPFNMFPGTYNEYDYNYGNNTIAVEKYQDSHELCLQPEDAGAILAFAFNTLGWNQQIQAQTEAMLNSNFSSYLAGSKMLLKNPDGGQGFEIDEASLSFKECKIEAKVTTFVYIPLFLLPVSPSNNNVITIKNIYLSSTSTFNVISIDSSSSVITSTISNISVLRLSPEYQQYTQILNTFLSQIVVQYFKYPIQLVKLPLGLQNVCEHICTFVSENGFSCC